MMLNDLQSRESTMSPFRPAEHSCPTVDTVHTAALQHTFGHEDCPACEATRDEMLRNDPDLLRNLQFSAAGQIWLDTRRPYLRPDTFYLAGQHVKHLSVFFGEMQLRKIHIGHIREYQKARTHNTGKQWRKPCGPSIINHETSALQQILERGGEWDKIKKHFTPIPLPRWKPPKVMSDEQEMLFFSVAESDPRWEVAAWATSLTVNTSIAGVELRNIQLMHLRLDARVPTIMVNAETAKEEVRGRVVPLNSTALAVAYKCLKRANGLGCYLPEHYLFPLRIGKGKWNPEKPASSSWLRRPFDELQAATGMPWLTPHCFRHQHATLSFESGEATESIRLRMGHTSDRMTQHYSSARREVQMVAVTQIDQSERFRRLQKRA